MLMYTASSLRLGGIYDLRGNAHWRAMARKSETNSETGVQLKKKYLLTSCLIVALMAEEGGGAVLCPPMVLV